MKPKNVFIKETCEIAGKERKGKRERGMALRLTCCGQCGACFSKLTSTIEQLQSEYRDDLRVVEVECMAACNEAPAVMLDYDFYPHVTPDELYQEVSSRLLTETHTTTAHQSLLVS